MSGVCENQDAAVVQMDFGCFACLHDHDQRAGVLCNRKQAGDLGETIFSAFPSDLDGADASTRQEGSEIEVTGVCELEFTPAGSLGRKSSDIAGLSLWLRGPQDVKVLAVPSCKANKEIAEELGVGEGTIKTHLKHVLSKLDAPDRTRAVTLAIVRGLLRL
jgi:hypothetical protein